MRPTYSFTDAERETIADQRYRHPDPRVQERFEILWLKSQRESHDRIAQLANVSRSTVQRTLRIYAKQGLDGIRTFHWKGPTSALTPHRETLEQSFREHPPRSIHEAAKRIEELTGVTRKLSCVRQFLKKELGMKCLKVAAIPVPPKKTVEEQAQIQGDFLKDRPGTQARRGS